MPRQNGKPIVGEFYRCDTSLSELIKKGDVFRIIKVSGALNRYDNRWKCTVENKDIKLIIIFRAIYWTYMRDDNNA